MVRTRTESARSTTQRNKTKRNENNERKRNETKITKVSKLRASKKLQKSDVESMGRKRKIKEKDLLEKIVGSNGFYSVIASRLHVDWHTVDKAIKDSPAAQEAIKAETEKTLDFVEGKAIERINSGDGAMIRFYLATKGKKRGFTYDEKLDGDEITEDKELNIITDDAATGGGEITEADE